MRYEHTIFVLVLAAMLLTATGCGDSAGLTTNRNSTDQDVVADVSWDIGDLQADESDAEDPDLNQDAAEVRDLGSETDLGDTVPDETSPDETVPDETVPDETVADLADSDGGATCPTDPCGADETCCGDGEVCRFELCIPEMFGCASDDECEGDSYCLDAECIPYGIGPRDDDETNPECDRLIEIGLYQPTLQCEWTGPEDDDPLTNYSAILSNPVVVDFTSSTESSSPSIVFHSAGPGKGYGSMRHGAVRILDGRTCTQQTVIDDVAGRVEASTSPAVGDIDGDGVAEIVSCALDGGLVAFDLNEEGEWEVLWHSTNADGSNSTLGYRNYLWNGPSIHDLDDDGVPEILFEGVVHNAAGVIRGSSTAPSPYYFRGNFSVVADVDLDDKMELITGPMVFEYDEESFNFVADPLFTGDGTGYGLIAVADFGDFPGRAGDGPNRAEIVVIGGTARIETLGGDVVFGPYSLPGGGTGGAPTVGDFDGDGRPEFAAAGRGGYTVFDLDCVGAPDGCWGEGIRWTQPSKDASSACTGSSVFDFEGDGQAEAIYADECYVRVYEGETGEVIFSAWRPSGTWYENPIVADVDGDFNSELVLQSNSSGSGCAAVDPIFRGLR